MTDSGGCWQHINVVCFISVYVPHNEKHSKTFLICTGTYVLGIWQQFIVRFLEKVGRVNSAKEYGLLFFMD